MHFSTFLNFATRHSATSYGSELSFQSTFTVRQYTLITGIGGPSYDAWRRHMTAVSYDGPEASYDGGVI